MAVLQQLQERKHPGQSIGGVVEELLQRLQICEKEHQSR